MYISDLVLYITHMSEISVTDVRGEFPAVIAQAKKKPVHIVKHGQTVAVLMNPELFEKAMDAMEELEDFDTAIAANEKTYPWDQVKRELGLA
jgi:prevent-host-death family protein